MKDWLTTLVSVIVIAAVCLSCWLVGRSFGYEAGRHDAIVSKVDSIKELIDRRCR